MSRKRPLPATHSRHPGATKSGAERLFEVLKRHTGSGYLRAYNSPDVRATVLFEPFDDDRIKECQCAWGGKTKRQRRAAMAELSALLGAEDTCTEKRTRIGAMLQALRKWEVRCEIVDALDNTLPPPKADARRLLRVQYTYKADLAGRRYTTASWKDYGDGKLRSVALQAIPGDLRAKLTGRYLSDFDGVNSDPCIILNECRFAGIPNETCACIRGFVENRARWVERVSEFYCAHAGWDCTPRTMASLRVAVKRWPNMLANGASYRCILDKANLPHDCPMETKYLLPLQHELKSVKETLLACPRNAAFVEKHTRLLAHKFPEKNPHELRTTLFSLLISTREDTILGICVEKVRAANRDAWGADAFDQFPCEQKWVGSLVFDGQMAELHPDVRKRVDKNGRLELLNEIESELARHGWDYKLDVKPNFGMQHLPVNSAEEGKRALRAAVDEYRSVREVVSRASLPPPKVDKTLLSIEEDTLNTRNPRQWAGPSGAPRASALR
mgnify:CR=1 FL=1|tara:strand:- start:302 stop:1801 length:1500 start_codon:yes stop_codon:yes gene_type:complete